MKTLDEDEEDVTSSTADLLEEGEELLGVGTRSLTSPVISRSPAFCKMI